MFTSVLVFALIAGLTPSLVWLFFWLREDIAHPEPRWLIYTGFAGGAIAVLAAIFAEKYIAEVVSDQSVRYILWAATEEIFKLLVIAVIALNTKFNDEPIDAMVYMITIALGFAAVENALFALDPFGSGNIVQGIATESMRSIGATLVHTVSSALIGFSLGYAFYRGPIIKTISVILGITGAIILHSLFNLSIINASPAGTVRIFMWIWAAVVILMILFEEIKTIKPKLITSPQ